MICVIATIELAEGRRDECLAILRHECGHCAQHAWRLHRRETWRRLFGNTHRAYPAIYRPNPASQRYVQHLRQYYAQAHPDEDFAETFATYIDAPATWRERYRDKPGALKKLQFVGRLIRTKSDTGIIVVLDNRILTKKYGQRFLDALPKCPLEIV